MAPLNQASAAAGWGRYFELARGGAASHLRPMEGLRGLAVFLVFLVHYATLVSPWLAPQGTNARLLEHLHSMGHAGVDLFFVLSGYLIYGHLVATPQPFTRYFGRRVKRIYPAFLVVFAVYVLLSLLRPADSKIPAGAADAAVYLLQNLLLLPGLWPTEPLITVAWSLSYEMFYYLVVPAAVALGALRQRTPAWRAALFGALLVAGLGLAAVAGGPVRLGMFLFGVLLYEALQSPRLPVPGSAAALAGTVAALAAVAWPWPQAHGQALRVALLGVAFGALCWSCFARPQGAAARLFSWTPLRWLGNMSYSYYLVHGLALKVFFAALAHAVPPAADDRFGFDLLLPAFAFTLLPSALLFLAVERPFSLAARPARARAPVPAH